MLCYLAGSGHQNMGTPWYRNDYRQQQHSGRMRHLNDAQFYWSAQSVPRTYPPHENITSIGLNSWSETGHLNRITKVAAEHFSYFILTNFSESLQVAASVSWMTGVFFCSLDIFWVFLDHSPKPRDDCSFWNTLTTPSRTNNHSTFKVLTIPTCLNALTCCQVIGGLSSLFH